MDKKEICIIGGAGFLGRHLLETFKDENITIIDIVDRESINDSRFDKYDYINYNISGFGVIKDKNFDYIFFLAGNASVSKSIEDPIFDINTNTLLLIELLETVKSNPTKIIFTSSAACLGEESSDSNIPISPYGVSKLASENYLRVYSSLYSIPILICRIFSIYGEYNTKQMMYDTVKRLEKDSNNITIYNPKSIRDFIYVGEVVEIIKFLAINVDFNCEIFDVGSGVSVTVEDMTKRIMKVMNIKASVSFAEIVSLGDPLEQISNIKPLISSGYEFKYNMEKGIRNTVTWALHN